MRKISTDLGSIYSSLNLRLDKFESSVTKALQGFYKLQTGTEKASSIMDKSVYASVSNISKSYELWEKANENTGKSIFDNSKKIESFNSQIKMLDSEIQKADKTLEDIEKQFGKGSKEVEEYKSHVLDLKLSHSQLTDEMKKAEKETGTFAGRLDLLGKEFDKIDNKFKAFDTVGAKFQSVGNNLTMGVTLPLLGVGVAASKVGMDFESQMSRVKAISGSTAEEFKKLNEQALELGASTAFSAKEAAEGMENLASAGFSVTEIMKAMPGMMDLAASSGEDLAVSADIAASTLRGFGLAADQAGHVADVLAKNASATNAAVADTGEAMKYVAPMAQAMGLSLEEVTAAIGEMANAGIKGSQAGTTLRGALSRLADPSKEAAGAMKEIGFNAFNTQGKLLPLNEIVGRLEKSTKNLTDKQKQQAISTIFGQEAMSGMLTLIAAGPGELDKLTHSLKNSDGAAKEMATTMQDNAKSAVEQMKGSLETAAIKIEQAIAPTIIKLADSVGKAADWFSNLSEDTQETIVKLGIAAATTGPLIIGLGKVSSGIGSLLKLGPQIKTFFGLFKGATAVAGAVEGVGTAATVATGVSAGGGILGLGASLGGLVVAAAPWLIAGAAVAGTGYLIYKGLTNEAIPAVDLFADKIEYSTKQMENFEGRGRASVEKTTISISEFTKKAVSSYVELDNQAKISLDNLYINSTTITEAIKNDMISKYAEMGQQIKARMDTNHAEQLKSMTDFFINNKNITEVERNDILNKINTFNTYESQQVETHLLKIKEILTIASKEKRQLTLDEQQEIATIQSQMKQTAVKTLSENELESKIILERMKDYDERITAEQASTHIKKLNEIRDKAKQSAEEEYNNRISTIIKMRDESKIISADQANKLIADAQRQRDETIKAAEETRRGAVDKIFGMNTELANNVDQSTGKIVNMWQRLWGSWDKWKPGHKDFTYSVTSTARKGQSSSDIDANASGTRYFDGGLTTMHERGYEVYSLPQGSRIYNHQASEAMVRETARQVAESVLGNIDLSGTGTQTIIVPVNLEGNTIATVTAPYNDKIQGSSVALRGRSAGL